MERLWYRKPGAHAGQISGTPDFNLHLLLYNRALEPEEEKFSLP
jgi:hypothetical protein